MGVRLREWLIPLFGGTFGITWLAVTLSAIFGRTEPLLGDRFWNWVASMVVATPVVFALALSMLAVDLVMLRHQWGLPTGVPAWVCAMIAPFVVMLVYSLNRPGDYDSAFGWLTSIVLPLPAVAFLVRLVVHTMRK